MPMLRSFIVHSIDGLSPLFPRFEAPLAKKRVVFFIATSLSNDLQDMALESPTFRMVDEYDTSMWCVILTPSAVTRMKIHSPAKRSIASSIVSS
jgi:hypothetical protein